MSEAHAAIDPNAIYSRQEVARLLGISLSTLKKLIDNGHLRVSRLPGMRRIFIKGDYVLAMLDAHVVEKTS